MDIRQKNKIHAAVVLEADREKVKWGIPVFVAASQEEQDEVAMLLARITFSMVHNLKKRSLYTGEPLNGIVNLST